MTKHQETTDPYSIRLFGGPELFARQKEILLSPQQRCLLALIFGSEGPGLSKDKIMSVLWPLDHSTNLGRRLNQLVYEVRNRAGDKEIIISRDEHLAPPTVGVASDLGAFHRSLDSGRLCDGLGLLREGFAPRGRENFGKTYEEWVNHREAELRRSLRRAADIRWQQATRKNDWESAADAAEVLHFLLPKDEHRLQKVMEAKTRIGRTEEALRAYHEFLERRQSEGWSPNPETRDILTSIHNALDTVVPEAYPEPRTVPLTGRDPERRTLRKTLATVPARELRTVVVSGEAGIGKTRLIREVLPGLPLDGHKILCAEAAELEKLIPLNPLIEAFRGEETAEVLGDLEEPWRTVLYGVMPKHYPGGGPVPEAPHIQPGSVPRRLFEAFHQLLLAHAQRGPMIMVLEDLQWADETTLAVLEFLVRRWEYGGLQLLVSVRSEEVRQNQVLGRFLENLQGQYDSTRIPLTELGPEEGQALIQHLISDPMDVQSLSQLQSLAGGNPFFLIELTLELLAGRLGSISTSPDLVPIPLSIRQVLDRRLFELSSAADAVLGAMAVNSRPLGLQALEAITGLEGADCLSGLDQLSQFRLITSHGGPEVSITHELVRQTVYQGLSPTRRSWLHERVGRHLLETKEHTPADELAIHFHQAGVKEEAHRYAIAAAEHAEASGAVAEALRFLRIARENAEDSRIVADLICKMGHLHYLHHNLEEAAPLLELAAQRLRRQGNQARALEAEVERIDCLAKRGLLPITEALEELARVKEEARYREEWGVFTKALDVEIHRLDHEGERKKVRSVLDQAAACADLGAAVAQCRARAVLALHVYYGSPGIGLKAAREAVRIAMGTKDTDLQLHALNRLIVVLLYQGQLHTQEGRRAFELAEARLKNSGDLSLKFFIKLNRAVWHLEVGEFDQSRSAFKEVEPVIKGTKATDAHAWLFLNEGELGLSIGDLEFAKASYEKAESYLRDSSPMAFSMIIGSGLGLSALRAGNLSEARKREADILGLPQCWTFDPSVVVTFKANMLRLRGDWRGAERVLMEAAKDVQGRLVTAWIKLTIERAHLLKRFDLRRASDTLRKAMTTAETLGHTARASGLKRTLEGWRH